MSQEIDVFIEAVESNGFGEYTLGTGDVLVTDEDSDLYVVPLGQSLDTNHPSDALQLIDDTVTAVCNKMDIRVISVEWDNTNDVFCVHTER